MMAMSDARILSYWLDVAVDLLESPRSDFPLDVLQPALLQSFDSEICGWNWRDAGGEFGMDVVGHARRELWAALAQETSENLTSHPMVQWYLKAQDSRPQSFDRVPEAFCDPRERARVSEVLRSCSMARQLAIPCEVRGGAFRMFVLGRGGDDYSDDELRVARRVQRVVSVVHLQSTTISGLTCNTSAPDGPRLTGRELAVLALLARGHGAQQIARRLSLSPRTVEKHIEHLYRKLEVRDRVSAVLIAMRLGLVPAGVHRSTAAPRLPATHICVSRPARSASNNALRSARAVRPTEVDGPPSTRHAGRNHERLDAAGDVVRRARGTSGPSTAVPTGPSEGGRSADTVRGHVVVERP
jgi:DNA-binding CsgD family transcriptional regulator